MGVTLDSYPIPASGATEPFVVDNEGRVALAFRIAPVGVEQLAFTARFMANEFEGQFHDSIVTTQRFISEKDYQARHFDCASFCANMMKSGGPRCAFRDLTAQKVPPLLCSSALGPTGSGA